MRDGLLEFHQQGCRFNKMLLSSNGVGAGGFMGCKITSKCFNFWKMWAKSQKIRKRIFDIFHQY